MPDVQSGRKSGYMLPPIFCDEKAPYKRISAAAHGYGTGKARGAAGHTSLKNTYEGRTTKPNAMIATYDSNPHDIEMGGWASHRGTSHKIYQKVQFNISSGPEVHL